MRDKYPGLTDLQSGSDQLYSELSALDKTNPEAVVDYIPPGNLNDYSAKLVSFGGWLKREGHSCPGTPLSTRSSDILMVALFENDLAAVTGNTNRGRGRPSRLVSLAKRYQDWLSSSPGADSRTDGETIVLRTIALPREIEKVE